MRQRLDLWSIAAGLFLGSVAASILGRLWILIRSRGGRLGATDASAVGRGVIVVLGAGLRPDGSPTGLLARRVEYGVRLFEASNAELLIMSGARNARGDEPGAMEQLAVALGADPQRVVCDRTGVDTAATSRYLKLNHPGAGVVLVTQEFHAARTAYLARRAGLDAIVAATPDADVRFGAIVKARVRELPASLKAVFMDRF